MVKVPEYVRRRHSSAVGTPGQSRAGEILAGSLAKVSGQKARDIASFGSALSRIGFRNASIDAQAGQQIAGATKAMAQRINTANQLAQKQKAAEDMVKIQAGMRGFNNAMIRKFDEVARQNLETPELAQDAIVRAGQELKSEFLSMPGFATIKDNFNLAMEKSITNWNNHAGTWEGKQRVENMGRYVEGMVSDVREQVLKGDINALIDGHAKMNQILGINGLWMGSNAAKQINGIKSGLTGSWVATQIENNNTMEIQDQFKDIMENPELTRGMSVDEKQNLKKQYLSALTQQKRINEATGYAGTAKLIKEESLPNLQQMIQISYANGKQGSEEHRMLVNQMNILAKKGADNINYDASLEGKLITRLDDLRGRLTKGKYENKLDSVSEMKEVRDIMSEANDLYLQGKVRYDTMKEIKEYADGAIPEGFGSGKALSFSGMRKGWFDWSLKPFAQGWSDISDKLAANEALDEAQIESMKSDAFNFYHRQFRGMEQKGLKVSKDQSLEMANNAFVMAKYKARGQAVPEIGKPYRLPFGTQSRLVEGFTPSGDIIYAESAEDRAQMRRQLKKQKGA